MSLSLAITALFVSVGSVVFVSLVAAILNGKKGIEDSEITKKGDSGKNDIDGSVDALYSVFISESIEVRQKLIDSHVIEIYKSVPAGVDWKALPSMSRLVSRIHELVKKLDLVDYFNYHMDMLERDDLVLLN